MFCCLNETTFYNYAYKQLVCNSKENPGVSNIWPAAHIWLNWCKGGKAGCGGGAGQWVRSVWFQLGKGWGYETGMATEEGKEMRFFSPSCLLYPVRTCKATTWRGWSQTASAATTTTTSFMFFFFKWWPWMGLTRAGAWSANKGMGRDGKCMDWEATGLSCMHHSEGKDVPALEVIEGGKSCCYHHHMFE